MDFAKETRVETDGTPPLTPPPPPPSSTPPPPSPLGKVTDSKQHTHPQDEASVYRRKRAERMFYCENMKDLDRDLKIAGVTKKGASWQYHIEVLDTRMRMPTFTDPGYLFESARASPVAASAAPTVSSSSPSSRGKGNDVALAYPELPPMVRYSVMRRYNDFRQLYLYLADTYGAELLETLPKFPDGGLISYIRGDDPRLLKFRKEQLQRFLRALDDHPCLKFCKGFTHFLRPDIEEMTTIGGMFQTNADTMESSTIGTTTGFAQPPASSSGYVSLSFVRSPEIRFSKQVTDGRGDWKRRRLPFPSYWDHEPKMATKKRVSLTEEEEDDEDDEDEKTGGALAIKGRDSDTEDQQRMRATSLLKMLSLESTPK
uniref:PX domain-containing protein n=1 Tax=Globisporangium ultimum (strain ATCC 200006 / CBS 805.95 / DAOM BR144) TaxID=431595 RepID=K3X301_GLOUD